MENSSRLRVQVSLVAGLLRTATTNSPFFIDNKSLKGWYIIVVWEKAPRPPIWNPNYISDPPSFHTDTFCACLSFKKAKCIYKVDVLQHSSAFLWCWSWFRFLSMLAHSFIPPLKQPFSGGGLWNNKNVFYSRAVSPTTFVSNLTDSATETLGRENGGCMMVQK